MDNHDGLRDSLMDVYPGLLRRARRMAGNAADAEDLVQEAIERGLRRAHLFQGGTPGRWLATILSNIFLDRCRRRACWRSIGAEWERLTRLEAIDAGRERAEHFGGSPGRDAVQCFGTDDVRRAAKRLSPALEVVFRLFVFEHLSQREIGQRLRLPISTVGTRLLRARRRLRDLLQDEALPTLRLARSKAPAGGAAPAVVAAPPAMVTPPSRSKPSLRMAASARAA